MIRFLFKFFATLSLAVAVVMAVLDTTRTVAAKALVVTPLQASWTSAWPDGLTTFQTFMVQKIHPAAWDPVALAVLSLPGFVVFAILAFLLYAVGRKPKRRIGRFVIDN